MSTTGATTPSTRDERTKQGSNGRVHTARRLVTETKASFKTTEFFAYLAAVVGLLIAGNTIEGQEGGADYLLRRRQGLALHHAAHRRLHDQPRPRQGRQQPAL